MGQVKKQKKTKNKNLKKTILKLIDFVFLIIYFIMFMYLANLLKNNSFGIIETITLIYCIILLVNRYTKQIKKI